MKYYHRSITERKPINKYGKLGYVTVDEYVKTNDIEKHNKGKRIKFTLLNTRPKVLLHAKVDQVVRVDQTITPSQAHFRKSVSKYKYKR